MRLFTFGVSTRPWFHDFAKMRVSLVPSVWNRAIFRSVMSGRFVSRKWPMRVGKEKDLLVVSTDFCIFPVSSLWASGRSQAFSGFFHSCEGRNPASFRHSALDAESHVPVIPGEDAESFDLVSMLSWLKVSKVSGVSTRFWEISSWFTFWGRLLPPNPRPSGTDGTEVFSPRFTIFRNVISMSIIPSGMSLIFVCHSIMRVNTSWYSKKRPSFTWSNMRSRRR